MCAVQGEGGLAVIEDHILPFRGFVTRSAVPAELPIVNVAGSVARETVCGRAFKHIVDMAGFAIDREVRSNQLEAGLRMVKVGRFPGRGGMAGFALPAELSQVRIHMAGSTVFGRPLEYVILMTACAHHIDVFTAQRKTRLAVIKVNIQPVCRLVARGAVCT